MKKHFAEEVKIKRGTQPDEPTRQPPSGLSRVTEVALVFRVSLVTLLGLSERIPHVPLLIQPVILLDHSSSLVISFSSSDSSLIRFRLLKHYLVIGYEERPSKTAVVRLLTVGNELTDCAAQTGIDQPENIRVEDLDPTKEQTQDVSNLEPPLLSTQEQPVGGSSTSEQTVKEARVSSQPFRTKILATHLPLQMELPTFPIITSTGFL